MLRLKFVRLMTIVMMCVMALPVMAQEAAAEATTSSAPSNISTLIILFGLGMIVVVGGRMYMKDKAEDNNSK